MYTYQCQLLRYTHDHVTGEFMNVGLIFYEPSTQFLRAKTISNATRLSHFFPDVLATHLLTSLHYFEQRLNQMLPGPGPGYQLETLTTALILPNDGALQLQPVTRGLTTNAPATFESLHQRLIKE